MKNTRRALRRHHRWRMIARSMKLCALRGVSDEDCLQYALGLYQNRQKCSCWMCGHWRKWHGLTVQERRREGSEKVDRWEMPVMESQAAEAPAATVSDEQDWKRSCRADQWSGLNEWKQPQAVM